MASAPLSIGLADQGIGFLERHHAAKVRRIASQLRHHDGRVPLSIQKRSVKHEVPKPDDRRFEDEKIDCTDLDQVLDIDPYNRVCVAESGVTFVELVNATLPYGLVPACVPELKEITLGGAVSGCSVESGSFRYGGFHDSCLEYEVITAEGEVLYLSREGKTAQLFDMMHGTFGTLGVLSQLKFQLVPARPLVKLQYEHHSNLASYEKSIWRHFKSGDLDFMDGIIFGPEQLTLSAGRFADFAPYTHKYDWVKAYFETTAERDEDYLRTEDYFFRYDRGVTNVLPKSTLARLLFGKWFHSSNVLRLAERFRALRNPKPTNVTLDVFIPFARVPEFMVWWHQRFGYYPLWCVPYRLKRRYACLSPEFFGEPKDELWLDLACYGMPCTPDAERAYRDIEQELLRIGGFKTLISYNYLTESEFWTMFDKRAYAEAKARMDPRNLLRDMYEKTRR
ncbi:MAG: FAD-binding oxidoreductase [Myxococcaceae bacterium]